MKLIVKTTETWSVLIMHVIFKPCVSVKCADGIATRSIAGTIESYSFKIFVCDDVTVPNVLFV